MYTKPAHTRRSATLVLSLLLVSLLGLGACATPATGTDESSQEYQVPTDGMRSNLRAQATKKQARMIPRRPMESL